MLRQTLVNNFLEHSAAIFPDRVALIHENKRLTYSEIELMANRLAMALLEIGVKRGDRVAVFMDNSIEAVVSIFAALKTGAAFVVINHTAKSKKLEYILNNSSAKVMITQGSRTKVVQNINCPHLKTIIIAGAHNSNHSYIAYEDIVNSGKDEIVMSRCIDLDLAAIIYTSGSTGNPKGVMLSHLNMVSASHSITTYLENTENDIILNVLPLSFDYGLYQVLMAFKVGCTIVLEKSFTYPYQVVDIISKEKVTGFPGVPTIFAMLLQMKNLDKYDLGSIRYITNTAAALPTSHMKKLCRFLPGVKLYSMYGLTECKRVSYLPPEEIENRPNSVGKGMPNQEVYIVNESDEKVGAGEVGELVVRGANVMLGYWEMPEETSKRLRPGKYPGEKVLYTGDLFRMDEEGYLYFLARKDDIMKCNGEKVSPKEIENVLYALDGIIEAVVVGIPDKIFGQAIKVYAVIEDGSGLSEKKILRHCSEYLENFMMPKCIEIVPSLPKTSTGKILKRLLEVDKIYMFLNENALKMSNKTAVIHNNKKLTYSELNHGVFKVASFLIEDGIGKGDRVAILLENSAEYIVSYFGVQKAGGISVAVNSQCLPYELKKILDDCLPDTLIIEKKALKTISEVIDEGVNLKTIIVVNVNDNDELLSISGKSNNVLKRHRLVCFQDVIRNDGQGNDYPFVDKSDIASIIYTSGTTGEPKGIMLSHKNFVANANSIIEYLNLSENDRTMVVLPFFYSYGTSLLTTAMMTGATLVCENNFVYPNLVLDKMVKEKVTGFAGVPSTFAILIHRSNIRKYSFPNLRYITQAGGAMSHSHAKELNKILPDAEIYIMYGQTEATARLAYLDPNDFFRKPGSIGKAIPGVNIELIKNNGTLAKAGEEGEIVAQGENIMAGYWNNPEETCKVLREGKLYTGDLAVMDEEGYLKIIARRSDIIKSGAHRISPNEIEAVILEIPEIQEAAVIGMEDEILGMSIRAAVVLRDGVEMEDKQVKRFCQKRLAPFKIPKEIVFVSELPKTSSGKIRKYLLKRMGNLNIA